MRAARLIAAAIAFAALVSCSPDNPPTGGEVIVVVVTPPSPKVQVGFQLQLNATVTGPPGIPQGVVWQSLNAEIAIVDGSGLVTGIGEGQGIIRVRWATDTREFTDVAVLVTTTPVEEGRPAAASRSAS